MRRIETEIQIDGTTGAVWNVLMDFAAYPEWNPFVREISGTPVEGEQLTIRLQAPGHKAMTMTPRVTVAESEHSFSWLGKLWIKGLFDGHHHFRIEEQPDGSVLFTQSEDFAGFLAPVLMKTIGEETRDGFELMNDALKRRVERG